MSANSHPTTRRGFIAALGFGGVSLYALWAGYGAAPGPWTLFGFGAAHAERPLNQDPHQENSHQQDPRQEESHGGHGATVRGPTREEFRKLTAEFVERYRLPDGTVYPRRMTAAADPGMDHGAHGSHAAAAEPAVEAGPLDVYLLAEKWSYDPTVLRLDAGRPYRFRMMAADVSHGASIQFGRGGRMIRLRPDSVAEVEMSFSRPGSYLVYCTVYCGVGHDLMQARIDVV